MCPHTHPLLANVTGTEVEHVRLAHIQKSNSATHQGQRERRTECNTQLPRTSLSPILNPG